MILSYLRTVILYLVLIAGMRVLGKRQIGQLEPSEFVVAMLVADLASVPMQNNGIPLLSGLVPILTVVGLELSLTGLTMVSIRFRKVLCGKPVILIDNGRLVQQALRSTRLTMDELTGHLRQQGILDIKTVQFAILETNGELSVFPYPKDAPATAKDAGIQAGKQYLPVTVIQDGVLCQEDLARSGMDRSWLERVLQEKRTDISSTFLLNVDGAGHVIWVGKEDAK